MTTSSQLKELLQAPLVRKFGNEIHLEYLQPVSGGASCDLWSFDIVETSSKKRTPLILRRPPTNDTTSSFDTYMGRIAPARSVESNIQTALARLGLPVPSVRLELRPEDGLGTGFIMDRISGESLPQQILNAKQFEHARRNLPRQLVKFRAQLNHIKTAELPTLPILGADEQIQLFQNILDWLEVSHPGIELGLSWLRDHVPENNIVSLVHGDFRLPNFLINETGLSSVIDWELAHLGDPIEDFGWLCMRSWRFSEPDLPAAGLCSRETLSAEYKKETGQNIGNNRLRFWEVLGNVKWAVLCLLQCHRYFCIKGEGIELAAVGRRVDEPIYDLLKLIEGID